jgi:ribosome biogenesis protein BRX1
MKRKLAQLTGQSLQQSDQEEKELDELSFSSSSESSEDEDDGVDVDNRQARLHSARDEAVLQDRTSKEEKKRSVVPYSNKQRVLMLSSRGITTRYRHFMEDLRALIPHHRKEIKHDTKKRLHEINEICEMKSCNGCLFFEIRKKKDLYLWATRAPNGPSVKFLVSNVHTMDELQMTGNCLFGSRPILSFSAEFDNIPYLKLSKELLSLTFGTPRGHPKSKPFVDRIMQFSYLDGRIWCRNFQIADESKDAREIQKAEKLGEDTFTLSEIGPRFVLTVVKMFEGSFGGRPLFENPKYVSPNEERAERKRELGEKYSTKKKAVKISEEYRKDLEEAVPVDELSNRRVFA